MKASSLILICLLFLNCSSDKELKLAEIQHSKIHDILDVSPAYLFYNPTKKDSIELNKQNLISTTNWLINVDKRLSLNQAIPIIIELQHKKQHASYQNKASKNYFTGFNPKTQTLCFLDFTTAKFHIKSSDKTYLQPQEEATLVTISSPNKIHFKGQSLSKSVFINTLNTTTDKNLKLILNFDGSMSFQNYMQFKDALLQVTKSAILIDQNEFIY